jgi:hypothetical protein
MTPIPGTRTAAGMSPAGVVRAYLTISGLFTLSTSGHLGREHARGRSIFCVNGTAAKASLAGRATRTTPESGYTAGCQVAT